MCCFPDLAVITQQVADGLSVILLLVSGPELTEVWTDWVWVALPADLVIDVDRLGLGCQLMW